MSDASPPTGARPMSSALEPHIAPHRFFSLLHPTGRRIPPARLFPPVGIAPEALPCITSRPNSGPTLIYPGSPWGPLLDVREEHGCPQRPSSRLNLLDGALSVPTSPPKHGLRFDNRSLACRYPFLDGRNALSPTLHERWQKTLSPLSCFQARIPNYILSPPSLGRARWLILSAEPRCFPRFPRSAA